MLVRIEEEIPSSVEKELRNLDEKIVMELSAKIEAINSSQKKLEELLMTKYLDKIRKVSYKDMKIVVFELRVTKKKKGNLRVLLCGIEEKSGLKVDVMRHYVIKVWKKKTQKIPSKYVETAIERFKSTFL